MTLDPEFVFPGGDDVGRLHVVDLTPPSARAGSTTGTLRYAMSPVVIAAAALVLVARRARRRA
jgi:hypothetical protein